jgi:hypothetical protein
MAEDAFDRIVEDVVKPGRIFVFGSAARASCRQFAMRLFHMGRNAAV